ncbi:pimeloyl-ACP methyl ester carboxylesterase [Arthrobacter sp. CAN_A214]|uniref:alpha/beta fold hydrolase n=1 Tax=Arthrobacter sp. CAN_A214 TaxID=2787720 RepID=UPI001A22F242
MTTPTAQSLTVFGQTLKLHSSTGSATPGPAFALVHGIGMSHRYLARLQNLLSVSADTYSLDLPGFGPNPRPGRPLSVEEHAAILVQVLLDAGVSRCVLVGHSMGTQIVAEAALQAPELVAGVVLIGPVVDRRRRTVLRQAFALAHDSLREAPSANLIVFTDYLRTGIRWYLSELKPMMTYPLEDRMPGMKCPALVLRGSRDPVARKEWCRELAETSPAGQFSEIEGHPHVVQHSAPAAVAELIRTFTRSIPSRADAK